MEGFIRDDEMITCITTTNANEIIPEGFSENYVG